MRKHSNGELAMLTVAKTIKKMAKDVSCHQFCLAATTAIRRRYVKSLLSHLAEHPEDRLTASCVVFSRLRREIWMIGDCQCLVGNHFFDNPKPYEAELAQRRADLITSSSEYQQWLANPCDSVSVRCHDISNAAREAIIPRMLESMQHQNNGYSVVDGFPIDEKHVRIIPLDFQPWRIVLATDGYPILCPTLAESEARLDEQRRQDPLNIGPAFKATKAFIPGNNSFDDRAYISFSV